MDLEKNNLLKTAFSTIKSKRWMLTTLFSLVVIVAVFLFFYSSTASDKTNTTIVLNLPKMQQNQYTQPLLSPIGHQLTHSQDKFSYTVKPGDTLSTIFHKLNLSSKELKLILEQPLVFNHMPLLRPGEILHFEFNSNHQLENFSLALSHHSKISVTTIGNNFHASILKANEIIQTITMHGQVQHNLYRSMRRAGIHPKLVMQFIKIFSQDLNLAKQIHHGDHFGIIYAATFQHNKVVKRQLLAAELTLGKKSHYAILDDHNFYTAHGINWAKAFLRTPIHYTYISSPFSLRRYQPILHIYRPHFGVDLAAPEGTPIHAASNGKIIYEGWMMGYGNVMIIKDGPNYSTRYAHMEKFAKGVRRDNYVKEGEIIGYVGMTGLATGPHLHYELHIDGKPVNPMTAQLPQKDPIFRSAISNYEHYVDALKPHLIG